MPSQSQRFKDATKKKDAASLPVDMQRALSMGDNTAILAYIEARVNALNMPPANKQGLMEIFKLILIK